MWQLQVALWVLSLDVQLCQTAHSKVFYAHHEQAITVDFDGTLEACYLCMVERELSAEQLRSAAVTSFTPIHSYMFGHDQSLLYATSGACAKVKAAGE